MNPGTLSGAAVARLYHRLLAAIFVVAWISLGVQIDVLIGSRGLLPLAPFLDAARLQGLGMMQFPTVFWLGASDTVLRAGIWIGAALSTAALCGWRPRLCTGLASALYLSYATACRPFLSFQWDNLLIESGALAILLPTDRPARWVHLLFRLLLFKLYWESGIAKWESYLGDWQDGSAMTFYYETAPLPTWLAWYAHYLPVWWHHLESWAVLAIELGLPFFIFGGRFLKLFTCAVFSAFQVANLLTSNYGFFVYLALALHVFLLSDHDVQRLGARLPTWRRRANGAAAGSTAASTDALRRAAAAVVAGIVIGISMIDAIATFAPVPPPLQPLFGALRAVYAPWRLINTYHLFGHITRERIEPEFQLQSEGVWQPIHLHHKPGEPDRRPDFVAPHQPRVDFQLWFFGLSYQRGMPEYVSALLNRLCRDPAAVQPLFRQQLPAMPDAVRIAFWRYHFAPPGDPVAWWTREPVAAMRPLSCFAESTGSQTAPNP